MSELYNLRTTAKGFFITKFDSDLNVLSSYNCTETTCECPQGIKPTCRHRRMIPIIRDRADSAWFWNFDQAIWVDPTGQAKAEPEVEVTIVHMETEVTGEAGPQQDPEPVPQPASKPAEAPFRRRA